MKRLCAFLLLLFLLLTPLAGCGEKEGPPGGTVSQGSGTAGSPSSETGPVEEDEGPGYVAPEISRAVFHGDLAEGEPGAQIDVSAVQEGYVAVSAKSEARLKFQVLYGDSTYTYDIPRDGTPAIFTLQSGDGLYQFQIMENVEGTSYAKLFSTEANVKLLDEFQPFLRNCQFADFTRDSACVKKAEELAGRAHSQLEAAQAVFQYICDNVAYDKEKASSVQKGYVPKPDETLSTQKGICFDYASLAASMLRSQGIPTKIIFGYVSPGDLYHAWNMFYTEESGWVLVNYEIRGKNWNRMDCTFAANGTSAETIGDGSHYADVYVY